MGLALPEQIVEVLTRFHTCEFATLARDGTPIVWPTAALYLPDRGQILITTSIGLSQKALNIRSNPRVSLLFSNPTGSGMDPSPAVLVQGDARVSDDIVTWNDDLAASWQRVYRLQPFGRRYSSSPPMRWFMDWYFMRLLIYVTPRSVRWWPDGDTAKAPEVVEVAAGVE
jgi:hypothetical protein